MFKGKWATKKKTSYFPLNPGCLIVILTIWFMKLFPYNWVGSHPLYTLNNQVFFHSSNDSSGNEQIRPWSSQNPARKLKKLPPLLISCWIFSGQGKVGRVLPVYPQINLIPQDPRGGLRWSYWPQGERSDKWKMFTSKFICKFRLHPRKTKEFPLKNSSWEIDDPFLLKWPLFRGHVSFQGCMHCNSLAAEKKKKTWMFFWWMMYIPVDNSR